MLGGFTQIEDKVPIWDLIAPDVYPEAYNENTGLVFSRRDDLLRSRDWREECVSNGLEFAGIVRVRHGVVGHSDTFTTRFMVFWRFI